MLFFTQANGFAASGANFLVTLLDLICIVYIPHNGEQYITASENCNPKKSFFLFFLFLFFLRVGTETHRQNTPQNT